MVRGEGRGKTPTGFRVCWAPVRVGIMGPTVVATLWVNTLTCLDLLQAHRRLVGASTLPEPKGRPAPPLQVTPAAAVTAAAEFGRVSLHTLATHAKEGHLRRYMANHDA